MARTCADAIQWRRGDGKDGEGGGGEGEEIAGRRTVRVEGEGRALTDEGKLAAQGV